MLNLLEVVIGLTNDFYSIAYNDLLYLQFTLSQNNYNPVAANAQQVAEKLLKSVINSVLVDDSKSIKTYNLRKLNDSLKESNVELFLDDLELSYLTDFYFDARYPGDDFVIVDKSRCNKCLEIMYKIVKSVNNFRLENGLYTFTFEEKYAVESNTGDFEKDVLLYCYLNAKNKSVDKAIKDLAEQCPEAYYGEYVTDLERAWKTLKILGEI